MENIEVMVSTSLKLYIPKRNHIIWLDFEPTKGKEIGKYRSACNNTKSG